MYLLLNVRLKAEDERLVRQLRKRGIKISEVVRAAIRAVHPWAVDAASRLESAPGIKDHEKVQAFVEEARK